MKHNKEELIKQFELEVWLYIDNDLDQERKEFWDRKISEIAKLKSLLDENLKLINTYSRLPLNELDKSKYLELTNSATTKKYSIIKFFNLLNPFSVEKDKLADPLKIAFGGVLAAAAILILMLSKNPNPVQDLSRDMLNWNSDKISEQISDVNTTISILKDENFKDLFIKKATNEKVDRDIYSISSEIEKLRKEINDQSF
jgi:hypothetical protein